MYEGIFDDFNTVKRHCKKNGNITFEESAVFELLEDLFPQHGSVQAVQIVIEMLDAQRIRDYKDVPNEPKLEVLNSDKSNDDSIIEVEVLRKIHPCIDLTNNSPESDDGLIIEKSTNENLYSNVESDLDYDIEGNDDSVTSDNDCNALSDSDVSKHFDDDWNQTVEDIIKSSNPPPLMEYLAMLEEPNKSNSEQFEGDQSNSGTAEISEMLEENNNDPNNNLDDGIFNEEPPAHLNVVDNNTHRMNVVDDSEYSNSNNVLTKAIDPVAGCSKYTEMKVNFESSSKVLPHSPVPGCSKDFNDSNDFELSGTFDFESTVNFDESIQNDAICIQEIVPWADLETIYSILKKHSDSPNRKQLTLWDLMSDQSNQANMKGCKRKQNKNQDTISRKSPKLESNDDIDESSLDVTPNLQSNNVTCNESSNDSQSSKISEGNESNSEVSQKNQTEGSEVSISFSSNKFNSNMSSNNLVDLSNDLTNNGNDPISLDKTTNFVPANTKVKKRLIDNYQTPVFPKFTCNHSLAFTDRPIKRERNETIVSGSLNESPVIQTEPKNFFYPRYLNTSLKERSVKTPTLSNSTDKRNDNVLNQNVKVSQIKTEIEGSANLFLDPISAEGPLNSSKEVMNSKSDKIRVIKPAKLIFQCASTPESVIKKPATATATSYVRPVITPKLSNNTDKMNVNVSNENVKVLKIKQEIEEAANFFLKDPTLAGGTSSTNKEELNSKSDNIRVIKEAKLILQCESTTESVIKKPAAATSYIRPATFNFAKANYEVDSKVKGKNDLYLPENLTTLVNKVHTSQHNAAKQKLHKERCIIPLSDAYEKNLLYNTVTFVNRDIKVPTVKPVSSSVVRPVPLNSTGGLAQTKIAQHINSVLPKSHIIHTNSFAAPGTTSITQNSSLVKAEPTATITSSQPVKITNIVAQPSTSGVKSDFSLSVTEVPDRFIYNKLRSIFPEVESSYVKKICINPPNVATYNDKECVLNVLIEHLLNEGLNHLRPVEKDFEQQPTAPVSVDEQYEYLLGIFPDADPTYLRDFVEKNVNSEQVLEQFIQQKFETRDYPTKEQYLAKIKITEQQKQYTTDFKIENFLELFPDPFQHFENPNRQCNYQPIAMEFLKSFFNRNRVNTIYRQYTKNKHNLSLTVKALSAFGADMKSKRASSEMPTEDIPLLQELAFVKNKQNILNHINTLKTKEQQLFKDLKEKHLLLTCQCCFNDECMPTKCSECNVGHVFCYECIIRGTESTLADGEVHVRCFTECKSEFSLAILQKVLSPTKFSALLRKRQTAEVMAAEVDGLVSCPFCHFASIPPPEDKIFKCLNPECMKETCRQCKELNHIPLKCDEVVKTDKARLMIEEKMTEALLRKCYKCKRQFYKEEGCNKMTCPCGALMCYICDKPVTGYAHFNPQGGANTHLCPLWSDDRRLNAEAVRKVAEDVKNVLLKANPHLKIDAESLLPKLPPKSKGPHDDIPNANQLPVRTSFMYFRLYIQMSCNKFNWISYTGTQNKKSGLYFWPDPPIYTHYDARNPNPESELLHPSVFLNCEIFRV